MSNLQPQSAQESSLHRFLDHREGSPQHNDSQSQPVLLHHPRSAANLLNMSAHSTPNALPTTVSTGARASKSHRNKSRGKNGVVQDQSARHPSQAHQEPSPSSSGPANVKRNTSHTKKKPEGHIKRPPNAFMLFRTHVHVNKQIPEHFPIKDHCDYSRVVAHMWHNLRETERNKWFEAAKKEKEKHRMMYPNYKFHPSPPNKDKKERKNLKKEQNAPEYCVMIADQILKSFGREGVKTKARATPPSRRRKTASAPTSTTSIAYSSAPTATVPLSSPFSTSFYLSKGSSSMQAAQQSKNSDVKSGSTRDVATRNVTPMASAASTVSKEQEKTKPSPKKARSTTSRPQVMAKPRATTKQGALASKSKRRAGSTVASVDSKANSNSRKTSAATFDVSSSSSESSAGSSSCVARPENDEDCTKYVSPTNAMSQQRRRSYSMSGVYDNAATMDASIMSIFKESADTADRVFGPLSLQDQPSAFEEELFVDWSERMAHSSGLSAATNLFSDPFHQPLPLARSFSANDNALAQCASSGSAHYTEAFPAAPVGVAGSWLAGSTTSKRRPERLTLPYTNMDGMPLVSPRSHSVSGPPPSFGRLAQTNAGYVSGMKHHAPTRQPLAHMQERPRTSHAERVGWLGHDDGPTLVSPMRGTFADARRPSSSTVPVHLWSPPPMLSSADFRSRMSLGEIPLPLSSGRMSFSFPQTPGTARSGTVRAITTTEGDDPDNDRRPSLTDLYSDDLTMIERDEELCTVTQSQQEQHHRPHSSTFVAQPNSAASESLDQVMSSLLSSSDLQGRDRLINDVQMGECLLSPSQSQMDNGSRIVEHIDCAPNQPTSEAIEATRLVALASERQRDEDAKDQHHAHTASSLPPSPARAMLEMRTANYATHVDRRKRKMSIGARYQAAKSVPSAIRPKVSAWASYSGTGPPSA